MSYLLKKQTKRNFKKYEKKICEKMKFSYHVWNCYRDDIMLYFGEYNPVITYAGHGDSRDDNLSEKLVPELYDNFIYYVHDGFYHLINTKIKGYGLFKDRADLIMKNMMEIAQENKGIKNSLMDEIYYLAVKWFG